MPEPVHTQPGTGARFDWGLAGAAEFGRVCAALVVVDVLSFTTAVVVAVGRGTRVHPFPWGVQAAEYARRIGAVAGVARGAVTPHRPWSVSPAALRDAPVVPDLVLPSPNGSAICAAASATGLPVLAGCLRNAPAVARWLIDHGYGTADAPIGVIAAGERWPDGGLRPGVEDLLGAAAILDGLATVPGGLSVEAAVALAALASVPDVPAAVRGCVSGRELIGRGFAEDVAIAAEPGVSDVVPVLRNGVFTAK
ncbi:2-phosphosulfolactate phosphatase [Micromonospora pattaloongensis]|uniref:Probable 2-phosphosulfolactate phosphatase n=1 Tax=Micromonospora pattaloongensis TaxID=405436 RepID=A0A1H3I8A7_9ACTN|nr:2-phosphosulfolactate phosphatase [Micromonospora pattaloongensis]SDY23956.1 2-phosphosulfolactate phosphatase [Micromonospora pattaloongensis]